MKPVNDLLLAALLMAIGRTASLNASEIRIGAHHFALPEGFEIELVAGTNLVQRPVSGSFDDLGRLYITDSSGSNDKPAEQLTNRTHRVLRLDDTDGDGRFDRSTVFADKMMIPQGCLWFDGSVYVAAPPSIWKLTDTNHDGVADVRVEWFEGKTLTGCANDLHGPYLGPDGWLYWCKGAFAEQRYTLPNGKTFVTRAAHIFRARPDGTGLEPVMTGGMDNPVGLAFTPEGERILCGTFFDTHTPGHRDGLIHAVYGGVYGKINEVTDAHKKTGGLMPVMTHMGAAAPCAVIRYESRAFGDEYRDTLFVANFNLHKITRHVLLPDGATFKTKDSDFLISDNLDFHPTDVIEDADGSLLVVDTGAWYKLCCPTSQLAKPDVLGAIYRIRKKGAPMMKDPRGLNLAWGRMKPVELAELLDDQSPAVRRRAVSELAHLRTNAVPALRAVVRGFSRAPYLSPDHLPSAEARRNAVWALTQIAGPEAREAARSGILDVELSVRLTACYSIALHLDKSGGEVLADRLSGLLGESEWGAVFEVLGRTRVLADERGFMSVFASFDDNVTRLDNDRILQHHLCYALIESEAIKAARLYLRNPRFAAEALVALDEMGAGNLSMDEVIPLLSSNEPLPKRQAAAWRVLGHHPEWGGALAGFFREQLAATNLSAADRESLQTQLSQFAGETSIQDLLAATTRDSKSKDARMIAICAMSRATLKQAPRGWLPVLLATLRENDEEILRASVAAIRALAPLQAEKNTTMIPELLRVSCDEQRASDLRLEALAALPPGKTTLDDASFEFLIENLHPETPPQRRSTAVLVLGRQKLTDRQLSWLATEEMRRVGPMEILKLLAVFEQSTNEALGLKVLASLKESKSLAGVNPGALKSFVAKYPPSVRRQADELLALLSVDEAQQKAHLDELLAALPKGDIRGGQEVFNSARAACASCHKIGYLGGEVGPDLTVVGTVRTERDLLEAIVYPSASFVRSYEPVIVATTGGEDMSGVVRKDAPDEVVLATGPNTEARIARAEIRDVRPGTVSVMPAGLDQQLTRQELADLVAFLKNTKWGPR